MGMSMSVSDDNQKPPSGKQAPQICQTCHKVIPCEHQPAPAPPGIAVLLPQAQRAFSETLAQKAARRSSTSMLAPCAEEDIAEVRRNLEIPTLVKNMIEFCRSLLECYKITEADATHLTAELARLEKQAEYLVARHACIEESKGKGVRTADFVDAHLKQIAAWIADCERFNQSFYDQPSDTAAVTAPSE